MSKHPRTKKLHSLMSEYGADGPCVARLMSRSLKTIHCWRAQSPAPIPEQMLELLELKLQQQFPKGE